MQKAKVEGKKHLAGWGRKYMPKEPRMFQERKSW